MEVITLSFAPQLRWFLPSMSRALLCIAALLHVAPCAASMQQDDTAEVTVSGRGKNATGGVQRRSVRGASTSRRRDRQERDDRGRRSDCPRHLQFESPGLHRAGDEDWRRCRGWRPRSGPFAARRFGIGHARAVPRRGLVDGCDAASHNPALHRAASPSHR